MKKKSLFVMMWMAALASPATAQRTSDALYVEACDGGDALACSVLGLMYETGGQGVERDLARAAELYGRACDGGDMNGCTNLGSMLHAGVGVQADVLRALNLYERACTGGELLACENLGLMYETGDGLLADHARAAELYEGACTGGLMTSCNRLGSVVQRGGGGPAVMAAAVGFYRRACDGGAPEGCVNLGVSYERGEGVGQDLDQAAQLYAKACDEGVSMGCVNLGSLLRTGSPDDSRLAVSLYRRACEAGEPLGCFNLGAAYEQGDGVPQDDVNAITFYQRACEAGVQIGCAKLPRTAQAQTQTPAAPVESIGTVFDMSGTVRDAETQEPLGNAIVDLPGLGLRGISDRDGRVRFREVPRGWHPIRVEAVGHEAVDGDLQVPGPPGEFQLLLPRILVADANAAGTIIGTVLQEAGDQGLANTQVRVVNSIRQIGALSNPTGRFTLTGLQPGLVDLEFTNLGYETRRSSVIVQPGRTIEVQARMSTRPIPLAPIEVVAVRSEYLERVGFYEREELGWGHQYDHEDLEGLIADRLSDVVRYVPGVTFEGGNNVGLPTIIVSRRRTGATEAACRMEIYVDDVRQFAEDDFDFDAIPYQNVEALEFYQGLSVPARYERQSSVQCGIVLVWTRRGA